MRLVLLHPGVARIDCNDCQKRWYDLETGLPKTYKIGQQQEEKTYDGPQFCPCRNGQSCPKESPEKAHEHELSEQNKKCFREFLRNRASPRNDVDDLAREAFARIEAIYREHEQRKQAEHIAGKIAPLIVGR